MRTKENKENKVRRRLDLSIARVDSERPLKYTAPGYTCQGRCLVAHGLFLEDSETPPGHKPSRLLLPNRGVIGTRWAAPAERVRFSWTPLFVDPATQSTGQFSNSADRTAPPPRFLIFWILWIVGVFGFLDFGI